MINDVLLKWVCRPKDGLKNNVIVVSKYDFPELVDACKSLRDDDRTAYISIEHSDNCLKYLLNDKKEHYLQSSNNVFNVEFDDILEDFDYEPPLNHWFYAINENQAKDMVDFIENNIGKDFIIHCRAGKSRSQGVCRFILDCYPEQYCTCAANLINPCVSPNSEVVRMLKRAFYEKHNIFQ